MTDATVGDEAAAPTVVRLDASCTTQEVEAGEYYHATVNGVVEYGAFVDLSEHVSGLIHESTYSGDPDLAVDDDVIVHLSAVRDNGDLSFEFVDPEEYQTEQRSHAYERTTADAVGSRIGDTVHIEGEVVQIKQTAGPTVFRVRDETSAIPCTAFEDAGVRAHPGVEVGDIVHVSGDADDREGTTQLEVDAFEVLSGGDSADVARRLDAALAEQADPVDVDALVDWPALEQLLPDLRSVARTLRRAVLEGRPIRMRHHADGDGMCASLPVQYALRQFIEDTHQDEDAARHLLKRLPSKAPYYEMEDATRDLNFALEDRARHGQKLPLLLMLDNGSTEEDTPAYKTLDNYDIPIVVVDHHHPDPGAVDPLVDEHVNPYLHGEDYRITTGMLCVELARMIYPGITSDLEHVPAVAGLSDRSKADAMTDYLDLARDAGYDESFLQQMSEALDYEAYMLRYDHGTQVIADILNVDGDAQRHRELVPFLDRLASEAVAEQLDATRSHVEHERVASGANLYRIDVENHAHRFTYPAPGKTTGEIHDRKVEETGEPVITIGYGPDFAVLRSDGVRLDIPTMVEELNDELPGAGVSGGGHLVVGSIRFVPGMRDAVLDALIEKMADAELDADLRSAPQR
ncbi:DHH family phosphoesterase [Halobacterium salinarum]|uniref:DHH family phosphoesterase n=1 Tax=Halobacterium TaxID=2239 RepID=UPI0019650F65|nr:MULTISPECIES: DHH family phosphoesterase [Halobacterium]MCF2165328.1 DHH family phosphoesterase [Halobacterium salinarum]MCF2168828.1 DHH family phosphoesterase [Halobacterium salinarum]MCF2239139.1 DHH family phosphoesterase [Halobacterium salinarum]MDL0127291.1 DHH family phosphoesterase [Halobacterium salinarum]MDL0130682.1 DHH family phosphoesterase [Halobacterium salinarum]